MFTLCQTDQYFVQQLAEPAWVWDRKIENTWSIKTLKHKNIKTDKCTNPSPALFLCTRLALISYIRLNLKYIFLHSTPIDPMYLSKYQMYLFTFWMYFPNILMYLSKYQRYLFKCWMCVNVFSYKSKRKCLNFIKLTDILPSSPMHQSFLSISCIDPMYLSRYQKSLFNFWMYFPKMLMYLSKLFVKLTNILPRSPALRGHWSHVFV